MSRGILFDLDGVLYDAERPIPGAAEAVAWVQRRKIPHLFVTNTTSRPRAQLVAKLAGFGIETGAESILTPPAAAAAWLRAQPPGPVALFVRSAARVEFQGLPRADADAKYVVIGDLGAAWDYATLNRAFRYLHHDPEARLVALGMTRFWKTPDGISLDVAPFVVALEHAADRKAVVLGKPAAPFFQAAVGRLGLAPGDVWMIGDDVVTDVNGAQAAGLKGALVRTGKFRESDLEKGPDAVLNSVADLPGWWPTVA